MTYIEENSKTRTTSTTGIGVNAFGIEIRNSSTVSSLLPSSVSASPTPTQQASADSGNDSATDTSGQLSVGAKAGIGVGAGVGGLLVLLFAAYFCGIPVKARQQRLEMPDPNTGLSYRGHQMSMSTDPQWKCQQSNIGLNWKGCPQPSLMGVEV